MATVACPNGHESTTTDYCDQCGARLDGAPVAPAGPPGPPGSGASAEATPTGPGGPEPTAGGRCPSCQSPRAGDELFCEVCGYDFAAGTLPSAPVVVPASPAPPASAVSGFGVSGSAVSGSAVSGSAAASGVVGDLPAWQVVVSADRAYYDRNEADDIAFPVNCPERRFTLNAAEVLVGRRSESRGIRPQLDLTGAPEDTGISHAQAILRRSADGSYVVIDPGSTNGVVHNDDDDPLAANVATPLADGDRLYIGAWTKLVFHAP